MENKLKQFLLVLLILFIPAVSWGQTQTQNYYIQDTGDGATFIQTFRWEANPYVQKYVFTIEKQNKKGKWEQIDKKETSENFVEESLSAGEYRYKLELYNFLGYVELETEWQPVSITKAYQPKINSVSPHIVYLEEEQDGLFTFDGEEISDTTEFVIQNGKIILHGDIVQSSKRNNSIKYQVNPDDLDTGKYTVTAKNIGGLTDTYKEIKIQFKKPTDLDISGGYSPVIIVGSQGFTKYFKNTVSPIGLDLKLTFIPLKKKSGYFGFSLSNTFVFLSSEHENYDLSSGMVQTHLDLVFQKPLLNKKLFIDAHLGAGLTTFLNVEFQYPHDITSEPLYSMNPCAAAGVSLLYYINKRLYLEAGVDYNFTINIDYKKFADSTMIHSIVPAINVGWQF